MLSDMQVADVDANLITFNAIISALEKSGQWFLAIHFLEAGAVLNPGLGMTLQDCGLYRV